MIAGVDHVESTQPEVLDRRTHRAGQGGRARALDLEAAQPGSALHDEVDFRPRVRRPEVALPRVDAEGLDQVLDDEALPGRADLWMAIELCASERDR